MTKPSAFTQQAPASGDGFPYINDYGTPASGAERICDFDQLEAALTVANMADASTIALIAGNTYTGTHNFGGADDLEIPNSATPTVDTDGQVAIDTSVTDFSHGILKYYGGEEMGVLAMPIAQFTSPADGYVPAYNATTDEFELVANGAGGGLSDIVDDTTPQLGGMLDVNGQAIGDGTRELLTFIEDASAVNHVNIENQATGGGPIISAAGDDTNIDLILAGKGAGVPKIGSNAILDAGDIGVSVQAYDADLDTYASITPSANVQSLLGAADYAAMRTLLDLEAGTDFYSVSGADAAFQPLDADLTAIAALTTTAAGLTVLEIADPGADRIMAWDDTAGVISPIALADITTEASPASGDYFLAYGAEGDLRKVDFDNMPGAAGGISNVVEDTTPQLGGSLDVNGQKIVSVANGNIDIEPNGTGNVLLGNFTFDADQTVGAGQDNYVLTYDNSSGLISLEASAGGGLANVVDDTTPQLGGMLDVNGQSLGDGTLELLKFTETASAVNEITVANAATGNGPTISATGDDTNIDLNLAAKGSGAVKVGGNAVLDAGDVGSVVQGYDATLDTYAGIDPSANVQSLLGAADYAAVRTLLDLESGTDFYSVSGADAAFQPLDSDLTAIAALSSADGNFIVGSATGWVVESGATARASLGVDAAGTDNSTDVTLAGSYDYLSLSGQQITLGQIDIATDIAIAAEAAGDIVYRGASNWARLAKGTDGQVLTLASGLPSWADATGGGLANVVEDTTPQLGGDLDTNGSNIVAANGDGLLTGTTAGNTLLLGAYDVDGAAYTTFATLTANNAPTMDLNTAVTIDNDKIVRVNPSPSNNEVVTFNGTTGLVDGNAGFTYDATARLYVRTFTAPTSTVELPLRVSANSSGTAANGYGAGIDIYADNGSANEVQIGTLEWVWTTATDAAEVSDLVGYVYEGGAKTEAFRADTSANLFNLQAGWQFAVNGTPIGGGGISNVVEDTTPQLGGQLDVNGNALGDGTLELLSFTETASAVNQINVTNNSTGNAPILGVAGDDANIDLVLAGKGTGVPKIGANAILDAGDIGALVQGYDADLDTWATLTPSANAQSLVTAADYAAMRALLDLEPGTDFYSISAADAAFQPLDADLTTWAGITPGTGVGTALAVAVGSAGAFVTNGGALGTPSSGTLTNATGYPGDSSLTTVGTVTSGNVDAVVSAASTTTAGKVELATTAEIDTATDTGRAMSPDAFAASDFGAETYQVEIYATDADVTTTDGPSSDGTSMFMFVVPGDLDGWDIVDVHAEVSTAGTTGTTTIDVNINGTTIFSAGDNPDIGSGQLGSDTGTGSDPGTINTAADNVSQYDRITIDVDAVQTGTAPKGLVVYITFRKP